MDKRISAELNESLGQLYLTTIRKRYTELAETAKKESFSYEQYLFSVVQSEIESRRIRRMERCLKESQIPVEKSLETFVLDRLPNKIRQQLNMILEGQFLEQNENILVFGNPGSGKTHLICALGQELIRKDKRVYFSSCSMLLQRMLAAKKEFKLPLFFKKLNRFDAVIIDDIGYVQQNKEEMEVLFTLLAERYERGSVMITSNLPFSKWERIFKDPMMAAAAIDRIVHHSVILELNLPSYRMDAAKGRKLKEGG